MPYCSNCGNAIDSNAKFCSNCGFAITTNAVPVNAAPAAQPAAPVVNPVAVAPAAPVVNPIPVAPAAPVVDPVAVAPAAPVVNPVPVAPAAPVVNPIPVAPAVPIYTAPVYTAPVVPTEPVVSTGNKVTGFVGLGLAIAGLVLAILGLLFTIESIDIYEMGFSMSVVFGILSMPMAIVGRMLCNKSLDAGNISGACSAGSKLGIAGLIVSCVMLFLGFVNLMG